MLEIELAQGLWRDGAFQRLARVGPLTGWAECALAEIAATGPANAEVVTRLLGIAVAGIGTVAPLSADDAAALTVGDRERLLFGLYRATFGEAIELTATCPRCGEISEMQIAAQAAPPPAGKPTLVHHGAFEDDGHHWRFEFRLPTGADQAELAWAVEDDIGSAPSLLLRRCIAAATCDGDPVAEATANPTLLGAFEQAVRQADPAADGVAGFACAACGMQSDIVIDAATILRGKLHDGRVILREVHRLARAYHWPERDILDLTGIRRRDYLALIEAEVEA